MAGNWPIHCAGLMMRTATLRALGGWAATPADDDLAMFAALSKVVDGYNDPALQNVIVVEDLHQDAGRPRQCEVAGHREAQLRFVSFVAGEVERVELRGQGRVRPVFLHDPFELRSGWEPTWLNAGVDGSLSGPDTV